MKSFMLETLPASLAQLTAGTPALWGKMSAQHMLEHLNLMFYLSQSEAPVQVFVPEEKWDKARAWLHSDKPFRRNLKVPTLPDEPAALRYPSFEVALAKLQEKIAGFYPYFEANPETKPLHPAFGPLALADWERFHYKHTTHHLQQFGLLPLPEEAN